MLSLSSTLCKQRLAGSETKPRLRDNVLPGLGTPQEAVSMDHDESKTLGDTPASLSLPREVTRD
jgi:hypothetical protein